MSVQLLPAELPIPAGVCAGTTLRTGGVSRPPFASLNLGQNVDDEASAVAENRARLLRDCGLPAEPVWLRQTHSVNLAVDAPAMPDPGTDALVTRKRGVVCAVLTADCLPVVLADVDASEVAVAHAGWRGLSAGIIEATLEAMLTPPEQLVAWLGPAISQQAFEVGPEVRQEFVEQHADAAQHFADNERGRYQADLYGLARHRLQLGGVGRVFGGRYCTFSEPERFFSYRRDGRCGRMATFVYLAPNMA